jgi:hypothetical protein
VSLRTRVERAREAVYGRMTAHNWASHPPATPAKISYCCASSSSGSLSSSWGSRDDYNLTHPQSSSGCGAPSQGLASWNGGAANVRHRRNAEARPQPNFAQRLCTDSDARVIVPPLGDAVPP